VPKLQQQNHSPFVQHCNQRAGGHPALTKVMKFASGVEYNVITEVLIHLPGQGGIHHQLQNRTHQVVVHSLLGKYQKRSERK
jgi:hypothetical protein